MGRPPADLDGTFYPELEAHAVADMVAASEDRAVREIIRRVKAQKNVPYYLAQTLRDTAQLHAALAAQLGRDWENIIDTAQAVLDDAYAAGNAEALSQIATITAPTVDTLPLARVAALRAIARDTLKNFHSLPSLVLRDAVDAYQKIVTQPIVDVVNGGVTRRQALQDALEGFAREGIRSFKDRAGRAWSVDAYADMAIRTGAHAAMRQGHADTLTANGFDLVHVVGHGFTCDHCAQWEGKVLSLTGATPAGVNRVEHATGTRLLKVNVAGTVEDAKAGGLFHPNCGHSLAAYFPGLSELTTSGEDGTPEAYRASQKQRRLERELRALKRSHMAATPKGRVELAEAIADRQARIRALLSEHPMLTRRYDREQ